MISLYGDYELVLFTILLPYSSHRNYINAYMYTAHELNVTEQSVTYVCPTILMVC